jgi:hypothetical protein
LNSFLLQSLSKIQKHLQQGPSNAELQRSERLKTPLDAQKHGMAHNDAGKSSSKRNRQGTKRGGSSEGNSTESFGQKNNPTGQLSSGTESSISKKRKRKKSQSFLNE